MNSRYIHSHNYETKQTNASIQNNFRKVSSKVDNQSRNVLVVLNSDINSQQFQYYQQNCQMIVVADGAYQTIRILLDHDKLSAIVGDLDSLVIEQQSDKVIKVDCQDCADITKCLDYTFQHLKQEDTKSKIYILGVTGRRMDHQINNISECLKFQKMLDHIDMDCTIVMVDQYNSIFFVSPVCTTEVERDSEREKKESVGILAFQQTKAITDGFKWDLNTSYVLEMGLFQSSSNEFVKDKVVIQTDQYLMLSISLY